jgi:type III pantothenate kinase
MSGATGPGLLAIDVGTSRVKLGWFPDGAVCDSDKPSQLPIAAPRLPEPTETFVCQHRGMPEHEFFKQLADGLEPFDQSGTRVAVASVNHAETSVLQVLGNCQRLSVPRILELSEVPIGLNLHKPTRVGIDRVIGAAAVNRVRSADTPALLISLGTACTVNLISADGVFQGGAILPGLAMSAHALHTGTSSLSKMLIEDLQLPENAVGKNTEEAMSAGLFWGMVGAIEKLIAEQRRACDTPPQLFLTGGDAPVVVEALEASGHRVRLMPHLVLSGIAIACEAQP